MDIYNRVSDPGVFAGSGILKSLDPDPEFSNDLDPDPYFEMPGSRSKIIKNYCTKIIFEQ